MYVWAVNCERSVKPAMNQTGSSLQAAQNYCDYHHVTDRFHSLPEDWSAPLPSRPGRAKTLQPHRAPLSWPLRMKTMAALITEGLLLLAFISLFAKFLGTKQLLRGESEAVNRHWLKEAWHQTSTNWKKCFNWLKSTHCPLPDVHGPGIKVARCFITRMIWANHCSEVMFVSNGAAPQYFRWWNMVESIWKWCLILFKAQYTSSVLIQKSIIVL